jgi:hypothetical protein
VGVLPAELEVEVVEVLLLVVELVEGLLVEGLLVEELLVERLLVEGLLVGVVTTLPAETTTIVTGIHGFVGSYAKCRN